MAFRILRALFRWSPGIFAALSFCLVSLFERMRSAVPTPGFPHRYKGFSEVFFASDTDLLILRISHAVMFIVLVAWAVEAIWPRLRRQRAVKGPPP